MANQLPCGDLGTLPNEIMNMVLNKLLDSSQKNKNDALPLRLVCKRFEEIIRPKIFKTIQLDFDRLSKTGHPLDIEMLQGVGHLVKGVVADLAVIRTESKLAAHAARFNKVLILSPQVRSRTSVLHFPPSLAVLQIPSIFSRSSTCTVWARRLSMRATSRRFFRTSSSTPRPSKRSSSSCLSRLSAKSQPMLRLCWRTR